MTVAAEPEPSPALAPIPFRDAVRVWLKIGLLGFGGPAGQIALMHRLLIEEKRWLSERQFLHALNYCMLLPGPEAQQLAIYAGWLLHGTRGGLVAGTLFVLPGALVILGLSAAYAGFAALPVIQTLFFGIKAAVLALVLEALWRIGGRVLKSRAAFILAGGAFLGIYALHIPFPLIVLGAGLIGLVLHVTGHGTALAPETETEAAAPDRLPLLSRSVSTAALWLLIWLLPPVLLALGLGPGHVLSTLSAFFSKLAAVTFGGAYAALAYVAQEAVQHFGWLRPGEMLDELGLAETTPGPLVLVLEYVGFMAAYRAHGPLDPFLSGMMGAAVTLWAIFTPSFLWIFVGAPYIEHLRRSRVLHAALSAITAAIVGVILNLSVWFGLHVLFRAVRSAGAGPLTLTLPVAESLDLRALELSAVALILVFVLRQGPLVTLSACAALSFGAALTGF